MTKRPLYADGGASAAAAAFEPTPQQLRTVIIASSAGTAFEWYDFFIFGTLSSIIAKNFFAGVSDVTGLILAFLVFGAGFIARPFGALVFGHFGDRIGRKGAFIVTISVMGLCTFLVGLLPSFAQIGVAAPIALVSLRLLQGFAVGGEYGGAAIYVAEHAPHGKRGFLTSWIQTSAAVGYGGAVAVILLIRTIMGEDTFAAWGWRIPFLSSAVLFLASLYIRIRIAESPVFERIKAEGEIADTPLLESFFKWKNLKIAIIALCSIMIAQGTLWYTAHFYAQVFIERTLKVPAVTVNSILIAAIAITAPLYVFWGWLSDKVGRKPVMLLGILMGTTLYFPGFHIFTEAGNPALALAAKSNPVVVVADPSSCSVQFDPVGKAEYLSSCDIAKGTLASAGVSYANERGATGAPAYIRVGASNVAVENATGVTPSERAKARAQTQAKITAALTAAGYPARADPEHVDFKKLLAVFLVFMVGSTALYGPMAAALVELFPTRIRYSGLSLPYHIGTGWFGGFMPAAALAIQVSTGNIYSGLWYPVATGAFCLIFALLFFPETKN
ncbi:MAG: MFS transporter, partial [Alphaproteobacteria bacterium]